MTPVLIEVSGHRRAGLHHLIGMLEQSFGLSGFCHLEDLANRSLEEIGTVIVKSHEVFPGQKLEMLRRRGAFSPEQAEALGAASRRVHMIRDPAHLLVSLYRFDQAGHEPVFRIPPDLPFLDFLGQTGTQDADPAENRPAFWTRTMRNWLAAPGSVLLRHEGLFVAPEPYMERIAALIEQPLVTAPEPAPMPERADYAELWTERARKFFADNAGRDVFELTGYRLP